MSAAGPPLFRTRPPRRPRTRREKLRALLRAPRKLRPTKAGWYFFVITLAVGFAALNTGNNLLYLVLSLMLAFLALSGFLSEASLRGIRVRRRLPRELYARTNNGVVLEIENTQRRVASFAVVVEDRVVDGPPGDGDPFDQLRDARPAGRAFALRIGPGARETRRYPLHPTQRGVLSFVGFRVSTRFPFGLFLKSLLVEDVCEALVFPAIEGVPATPTAGDRGDDGEQSTREHGAGVEVDGLRDFRTGDSLRRVQWRASLRRASLLVRETLREHDAHVEVRLQTRGAAAQTSRFEAEVRRAASQVVANLDAGFQVGLRSDDARFEADDGDAHRRRLLAYLAQVQPQAESTPERPADPATPHEPEARVA